MEPVVILELAFAALVAVVLPVRAWRRRFRPAPVGFARYLIETSMLTTALALLLWRNRVPAQSLGLAIDSYPQALIGFALCFLVVVGPDAWAAWRIAATARHGQPLPDPDPLFAAVAAGRQPVVPFVAAMIVGAIWEELCFRATALALVPRTAGYLTLGVVGGALIFAAQHLRIGIRRAAISFGYGVMFAVLFLVTANLAAVVAAHAAGNLLSALEWTPRLERARRAVRSPSIFIG